VSKNLQPKKSQKINKSDEASSHIDLSTLTDIEDPQPNKIDISKEYTVNEVIKENPSTPKSKKTIKETKLEKDIVKDIKNEHQSTSEIDDEDEAIIKAAKYRKRLFLAMKIIGLLFLL